MRSLSTLSLVGLTVGTLFAAQASADVWTKASVDLVGVAPDTPTQAYVYLTDTAATPLYTKRFFRVKGKNYGQALDVLLAASINGRKVHFLSNIDTVAVDAVPIVSVLYLTTEPVAAAP